MWLHKRHLDDKTGRLGAFSPASSPPPPFLPGSTKHAYSLSLGRSLKSRETFSFCTSCHPTHLGCLIFILTNVSRMILLK